MSPLGTVVLRLAGSAAVCAASLAAAPAHAQVVLENERLRLEIIGLSRWTPAMIQDSLARRAPGRSIMTHACAVVLREQLGFADAAVNVLRGAPSFQGLPARKVVSVTVVEPQDSALVRYRPAFRDTQPSRATSPSVDATQTAAAGRAARRTLARDGNESNRIAAVVILSRRAADDSTWWALVDALRDPSDRVSGLAARTLATMTQAAPRVVDWSPVAPTLRALLDGTNLFAHDGVAALLADTEVSPALAAPLLRGGGRLVVAKLGSEFPMRAANARRMLVRLAGRDLGADPAAWRDWIATL